MSFLAPLFLLGALAVALPIIFHLIRRTTREKTIFSSLMFLLPTPPRLTKRSRLEHIFLLILRCIVLCLLAFAFARPFIQKQVDENRPTGPGRKIVVLVDTSASMRRGNLWAEARARAEKVLREATPIDRVALFTFDHQVNRLVTLDEWNSASAGERAGLAATRLRGVSPGWASTHLGNALVAAAETLEDSSDKQPVGQRQVVLISDVQEGSRLDHLQSFEWPRSVELVLETVKPARTSNAGLQLIAESDDGARKPTETATRVRVTNAGDSQKEQFQVGWAGADGKGFAGAAQDVYVPPGQSRVVSLPAQGSTDRVLLRGDDEDFDNLVYFVSPEAARVNILYLGNDLELDTTQPVYFLRRAFQETRRQIAQVVARKPDAVLLPTDTENMTLFVIADTVPEDRAAALRRMIREEGKTALVMLKTADSAGSLGRLLEMAGVSATEAAGGSYSMLGEINFQHPIFAPFADPRFSDFTKLHFWKHRKLETNNLAGARSLARFDNGDPALLEVPLGKGRVFVLTAGWHPADSQLALSSKFVPLLYSILELSGGAAAQVTQHSVGDTIPLIGASADTTVRKPDNRSVKLTQAESGFSQADQPGVYQLETVGATRRFAVNLDPAESKTAALPVEELERLGLPLKPTELSQTRQVEARRQLMNSEVEGRQKLWRWVILAALTLVVFETLLAGWLNQRQNAMAR